MFNWLFSALCLIILSDVYVHGRFRRISSGLSPSTSQLSGRWRLMSPNDVLQNYPVSKFDTPKRLFTYSPDDYLTSKRFPNEQFTGSLFNQRHQSIIPIKFTSRQRLPIYLNHRQSNNHLDQNSAEYETESVNNQLNSHTIQSKLNEQTRTNEQIKSTADSITERQESTTEKVTNSQIIIPTSTKSSILEQSDSISLKAINKTSPKGSAEVSSQSTFKLQRFAYMKKAAIESVERPSPVINHYRSLNHHHANKQSASFSDLYFVAIVVGSSGLAIFAVIGAGYCFYRFQQHNKSAADVDYPAYGVVGPITKDTTGSGNISPIGDRKLAQSAQMYHYHHQKQQMIASEKVAASRHTSASDVDSEEENEEGDYTVYECPGLASTGEMEVKNPLFQDDITPVSSPSVVNSADSRDKK